MQKLICMYAQLYAQLKSEIEEKDIKKEEKDIKKLKIKNFFKMIYNLKNEACKNIHTIQTILNIFLENEENKKYLYFKDTLNKVKDIYLHKMPKELIKNYLQENPKYMYILRFFLTLYRNFSNVFNKINAMLNNTTNSVHNQNNISNSNIFNKEKSKEKTETEKTKENENLKIEFENLLALTKELKEKINDNSIKILDKPKIIINYANKIMKTITKNNGFLIKIFNLDDLNKIKNFFSIIKYIEKYDRENDNFIIENYDADKFQYLIDHCKQIVNELNDIIQNPKIIKNHLENIMDIYETMQFIINKDSVITTIGGNLIIIFEALKEIFKINYIIQPILDVLLKNDKNNEKVYDYIKKNLESFIKNLYDLKETILKTYNFPEQLYI